MVAAVHVGRASHPNVKRERGAVLRLGHQRSLCVRVVPYRTVGKGDAGAKRPNGEVGPMATVFTPRMAAAFNPKGAPCVPSVHVGEHVEVAAGVDEHRRVFAFRVGEVLLHRDKRPLPPVHRRRHPDAVGLEAARIVLVGRCKVKVDRPVGHYERGGVGGALWPDGFVFVVQDGKGLVPEPACPRPVALWGSRHEPA